MLRDIEYNYICLIIFIALFNRWNFRLKNTSIKSNLKGSFSYINDKIVIRGMITDNFAIIALNCSSIFFHFGLKSDVRAQVFRVWVDETFFVGFRVNFKYNSFVGFCFDLKSSLRVRSGMTLAVQDSTSELSLPFRLVGGHSWDQQEE